MENKAARKMSNEKTAEKAIEDFVGDIRREEVPPRLRQMAETLQAALEAREGDRR